MKQLQTWLTTGSILIVLTLFPGLTNAAGLYPLLLDINTVETDDYYQPTISGSLFEEIRVESSYLFSHSIDSSYIVGLNYTDVTIVNNQPNNQSNSSLLVMLQFKF